MNRVPQEQRAAPDELDRWHELARRRLRRARFAARMVALLAALGLGAAVILLLATEPEQPIHTLATSVLVITAVFAAVSLVGLASVTFAQRHLLARAIRTRLTLCAFCGKEPVPDLSDGRVYCPDCDHRFDRATLRAWWWTWAEKGPIAAHHRHRLHHALYPHSSNPSWTAFQRRHPWIHWAFWLVPLPLVSVVMSDHIWPIAILNIIPLWLCLAGFATLEWIWRLTRRRIGHEWRCARCGYPRAPFGPHPILCPECGAIWSTPSGLVYGRPRLRRSVALALTAPLVLLSIGALTMQLKWQRAVFRVLPNTVLIYDIVHDEDGGGFRSWQELSRRSLTQEQRLRLARRIIERLQHRPDDMNPRELRWLARQFQNGALDERWIATAARHLLTIRLEPDQPAHPGQACTLKLVLCARSRRTAHRLFGPVCFVVQELTIDGRPLPQPVPGTWRGIPWPSSCAELPIVWTPARSGRHSVRAVVWIVAGLWPSRPDDRENGGRIAPWSPDGSPALPAGTFWSRRVVLTRELTVRPPAASAPALQP